MTKFDPKPWDQLTIEEKKALSAQLREEMKRLPKMSMSDQEAQGLLDALSEQNPPDAH